MICCSTRLVDDAAPGEGGRFHELPPMVHGFKIKILPAVEFETAIFSSESLAFAITQFELRSHRRES
jgi:hypothetical protein